MARHIDYDRAFARYKVLRSVQRHVDSLLVEHPDYRITARSPFLVYPNGGLYFEKVVDASLRTYWTITDEFLLSSELDSLARCALKDIVGPDVLEALDMRARTFFPWLTRIRRTADMKTVQHLKTCGYLN